MPNVTPPPVPTQSKMLDSNGLATRPWISWFTTLGQLFGYYQTIWASGKALPQQAALNFIGFITADNPSTGSTNISLPAPGFTLQKGSATVNPTGGDYASADVIFTTPFGDIPNVQATANGFPRGVNTPMTCVVTNKSLTGFTVQLACAVPTGGGGATIDQEIPIDWVAIA